MLFANIGLRQEKHSFQDLAALGLFFLLPFDHTLVNIAIGLILLWSLIHILRTKAVSIVRVPWILPVLFVYWMISGLASGAGWQELEKRLLLLGIPLLFALNPNYFKEKLQTKIFASYILGNVFVLLFCFLRASWRSLELQNGMLMFDPKVVEGTQYDFLTSSVMGGNYFFEEEFSAFFHPMYFGLYIVFAQYLLYHLYRSTGGRAPRGWLFIATYFFFMTGLFFLSSKAAIISALLLALYIFFRSTFPTPAKIATLITLIGVSTLFLYFNPKLKILRTGFSLEQFVTPDPLTQTSHGLRILSWNASLAVIGDHWLFGVGEGKKESALTSVYQDKGYVIPLKELHNSHNQYLDILIGGGIIGFGLFAAGVIPLFRRGLKARNFPLIVFLSIFFFMAMFENLLSRYAGLLLFTVFVSFLGSEARVKSIKKVTV